MLDFQLIVKSSGEIGIEQILADYKPVPLPADDLERVRAHQEFCAQRAQQLHRDQRAVALEASAHQNSEISEVPDVSAYSGRRRTKVTFFNPA